MPAHPTPTGEPSTERCPGCGAVLAPVAAGFAPRPGASSSCTQLFEVTLRGLREEAAADPAVAAVVRRADDAYQLQHAVDGGGGPGAWQTTIADVAADLDVIDLTVLVEAWATAVHEDVAAGSATRR